MSHDPSGALPPMQGRRTAPALDRSPADAPAALLARAAGAWHAALRTALAPLDLTPAQFELLVAVAWLQQETGTGVRQSDAAALADSDPVTASTVLRTLERRGLVDRVPHATDRRARAVTITVDGATLAASATEIAAKAESAFFEAGLPGFRRLAKALKKGGRGR